MRRLPVWTRLLAVAAAALVFAACEHPHHTHPTLVCVRSNESAVGYPWPNDQNYDAQNPRSSASGAYQFIDRTWRAMTRESGIGTEYARAKHAPEFIQDAVAYWAMVGPGKYKSHWTGANRRCF